MLLSTLVYRRVVTHEMDITGISDGLRLGGQLLCCVSSLAPFPGARGPLLPLATVLFPDASMYHAEAVKKSI